MIEIEGGIFEMGNRREGGYGDEKPEHEVQLNSFWLGKMQVDQALWEEVMRENSSRFLGRNRPVERVNWYDCIEFCNKLSEKIGYDPAYEFNKDRKDPNNENEDDDLKYWARLIPGSNGFRLPTEAEWEYAARGGKFRSRSIYAGSHVLDNVGWYGENSTGMSQPVGLQAPNELGLYGMTGNVWEWCWDWFGDEYYKACAGQGVISSPCGPEKGRYRVLRGGSWNDDASDCRVAYRLNGNPRYLHDDRGLRLARTA